MRLNSVVFVNDIFHVGRTTGVYRVHTHNRHEDSIRTVVSVCTRTIRVNELVLFGAGKRPKTDGVRRKNRTRCFIITYSFHIIRRPRDSITAR